MSQTPRPDGRAVPSRRRILFPALLAVDVAVTLFPPLYWAAGSGDHAWSALLYVIGGSGVVLASILAMYAVDRTRAADEEARP